MRTPTHSISHSGSTRSAFREQEGTWVAKQIKVDAMARTTTYAYTVDDRIAKTDNSDSATPDVTYAYDAWYPRLTSHVDGTGTTTFTYHPDAAATNGAGQVAPGERPVVGRHVEVHVR
jgi:hypothetical protein